MSQKRFTEEHDEIYGIGLDEAGRAASEVDISEEIWQLEARAIMMAEMLDIAGDEAYSELVVGTEMEELIIGPGKEHESKDDWIEQWKLGLTIQINEHPEGWEEACLCRLCCSYGD